MLWNSIYLPVQLPVTAFSMHIMHGLHAQCHATLQTWSYLPESDSHLQTNWTADQTDMPEWQPVRKCLFQVIVSGLLVFCCPLETNNPPSTISLEYKSLNKMHMKKIHTRAWKERPECESSQSRQLVLKWLLGLMTARVDGCSNTFQNPGCKSTLLRQEVRFRVSFSFQTCQWDLW